MQVNTDSLLKFADNAVEEMTHRNFEIIGVYLRGSVALAETPLLGGAADIDLVFIHNQPPEIHREIQRITDDVHLDIAHHDQKDYLDRRALRVDPWMGPGLFNAKVLFDPQHFVDFTLASVRGMFDRPDNVIQRARVLAVDARQTWRVLEKPSTVQEYQFIGTYLETINLAANALARLVGEPLTSRRFVPEFEKRVARLDRPGMVAGLLGLLGAPQVDLETLHHWVAAWDMNFSALAGELRPVNLHSDRRNYFLRHFVTQLTTEHPEYILWPLIQTWTQMVAAAPQERAVFQKWFETCHHLGLLGDAVEERIAGLDAYLEQVEDVIEAWAHDQGV